MVFVLLHIVESTAPESTFALAPAVYDGTHEASGGRRSRGKGRLTPERIRPGLTTRDNELESNARVAGARTRRIKLRLSPDDAVTMGRRSCREADNRATFT
jgi:hypothetical protein